MRFIGKNVTFGLHKYTCTCMVFLKTLGAWNYFMILALAEKENCEERNDPFSV